MLIKTNDDHNFQQDEVDGKFTFYDGGMVLHFDGDPVAYNSSNVVEKSRHVLHMAGREILNIQGGKTELYDALAFKDKAEFDDMLNKNPAITYEEVKEVQENVGGMYNTIKSQIQKVIKTAQASSVRIYLTDGATNFRLTEEIATILKYKGNRPADAKPAMLGEARRWMMEELGAELITGMEADDKLSIEHRKGWETAMQEAREWYSDEDESFPLEELEKKAMELTRTTLASIDKDLKMCAGKFINPSQDLGVEEIFPMGHLFLKQKTKSKKLEFSGIRGFYAQLLMGDSCDNIPTAFFCGDARVFEVLNECKTEKELFQAALTEIYTSFQRQHLKFLSPVFDQMVEDAIRLGEKDTKSGRPKLKKKFKDIYAKTMKFQDKKFYHWSEYALKEDGTVSSILSDPDSATLLTINPVAYMTEVAQLLYMLEVAPDSNGNHLWKPNMAWAQPIIDRFERENLTRMEVNIDDLVYVTQEAN